MEILRLLVAGHTVKTIAARLGRSETSINERLRSARRKTGVGSSRELARLLDRQKTCDENIDLSGQHSTVKDLVHTATDGVRSEEHTSELQSLMRISYAVFCLKKKNNRTK